MEKETGKELWPTYAFWRMYVYNSNLKVHKDRPACEISVTVAIGNDGSCDWPIFMEGTPVNLDPGDAVIYQGCELKHWREEYKGDWFAQTFLHYVDKNGPNAEWKMDKRPIFGKVQ